LKTFFDGIFIDREILQKEEIQYPIKLEYYRTITSEENVEARYGIEIVKTEYINGNVKIESSKSGNITNDVKEADKILELLRNNEVTPIGMQDVLEDMFANT
jgi:hypothetical protein